LTDVQALSGRATAPVDVRASSAADGRLWRYYAGFGLSRLATVVVLPIVSRIVGPADFGFFEASFSLMLAAMVIGDPGVGTAVVRFFGDGNSATEPLLRNAAAIQGAAAVVAFIVFAVPALAVAPSTASRGLVLGSLALFTLVEGFSVTGAAILRAAERFRAFLWLAVLRVVLAIGVGALGAYEGGAIGGLFGVAVAGAGFALVGARPLWRFQQAPISRTAADRLLRYGLPLIGTSLMAWALSLSDRLFLRIWATPVELGRYAASYRLGSVVMIFVAGPLALAWVPVARRLDSPQERDRRALLWAIRIGWLSLGAGVVLVSVARTLVPAVFGAGFTADQVVVAAVVVSGWLFGLYFLVATEIFLRESTGILALAALAVVVVNLSLNALLIEPWGPRGAALATVLSYLALCAIAALTASGGAGRAPRWVFAARHVVPVALLLALIVVALFHAVLACLGLGALGLAWLAVSRRFGV